MKDDGVSFVQGTIPLIWCIFEKRGRGEEEEGLLLCCIQSSLSSKTFNVQSLHCSILHGCP